MEKNTISNIQKNSGIKWHDAKTDLPEKGKFVLGYDKQYNIYRIVAWDGMFWQDGSFDWDNIDYWAELPEVIVDNKKENKMYVSKDGKFSSEYSHEVDAYEREQRRPYVEEYKKRLDELVNYVKENELFLKPVEYCYGDFSEMVLFLLFRKDNADEYIIKREDDHWSDAKVGDF